MWILKGCQRCGGDVFIDKDEYGWWYKGCLQCGWRDELTASVKTAGCPVL
jgi:predicted  nucleic acid-binding Zn-ribbon protein